MNDYGSKPIDQVELFKAIARACGHGDVVPEAVDTVDGILDDGGHEELDAAATGTLRSLLDGLGDITPSGVPEDEEAQLELEGETSGGTFDTEAVPLYDEKALDRQRDAIGDEVYHQMLQLVSALSCLTSPIASAPRRRCTRARRGPGNIR